MLCSDNNFMRASALPDVYFSNINKHKSSIIHFFQMSEIFSIYFPVLRRLFCLRIGWLWPFSPFCGVLLIKNRGFYYKSRKYTIVPMEYYPGPWFEALSSWDDRCNIVKCRYNSVYRWSFAHIDREHLLKKQEKEKKRKISLNQDNRWRSHQDYG